MDARVTSVAMVVVHDASVIVSSVLVCLLVIVAMLVQ